MGWIAWGRRGWQGVTFWPERAVVRRVGDCREEVRGEGEVKASVGDIVQYECGLRVGEVTAIMGRCSSARRSVQGQSLYEYV